MKTLFAVFGSAALMLAGAFGAEAATDEVILAASYVDDGSCDDALMSLSAQYEHVDTTRRGLGYVRSAPSGGDCETEAISYQVELEQRFPGYGFAGSDVLIKIGASAQTTSATYALANEHGSPYRRGDGQALFATRLPAGRAETILGIIGFGRQLGPHTQLDLGVNVVPTDFAEHSPGRTLHAALTWDRGPFTADLSADFGREIYGDAALVYTPTGGITAAVRYQFGLDVVDGGAPAMQTVRDANFVAASPPQSDVLILEIGWKFGL